MYIVVESFKVCYEVCTYLKVGAWNTVLGEQRRANEKIR